MKLHLSLLAAVAVILTTATVRAEDKEATFKVAGMKCGACENAVSSAVTKLDGVKSIDADSGAGTATVKYDAAKTDEKKIAAAIDTTKFKVQH